ncbi:MAG: hypothetical protein KBD76_14265 [Bacteriovorax sp.]|nr:hypothetical protein [Bacteriovorax sp.]
MKKVSFVVGLDYQNNRIFDLTNKFLNRDNCLYPYFLLKEEFKKHGYDLLTSDLCSPDQAHLVLYNEMPKPFPKLIDIEKSFLLLFETELIRADNWNLKKHKFFKKIFTWNNALVDNKLYYKFNFPNEIKSTPIGIAGRSGFLVSISGNKTSHHPLELYSQRLKTIKWFEDHHPEDLDFYGIGWEYKFNVRFQKIFRKLKILNLLPKNSSRCYKGRVDEKIAVLRTYKFALCFENAKDIDGYITEKIFDCFFAGTIPIYWGPSNINQIIPENCYIERTKFNTHEDLYHFLKKLTDEDILAYQKNIELFLKSEGVTPFSEHFFAKNIVEIMTHE